MFYDRLPVILAPPAAVAPLSFYKEMENKKKLIHVFRKSNIIGKSK